MILPFSVPSSESRPSVHTSVLNRKSLPSTCRAAAETMSLLFDATTNSWSASLAQTTSPSPSLTTCTPTRTLANSGISMSFSTVAPSPAAEATGLSSPGSLRRQRKQDSRTVAEKARARRPMAASRSCSCSCSCSETSDWSRSRSRMQPDRAGIASRARQLLRGRPPPWASVAGIRQSAESESRFTHGRASLASSRRC